MDPRDHLVSPNRDRLFLGGDSQSEKAARSMRPVREKGGSKMPKPSTDTVTERAVERYRRQRIIPARVTLRFLALLRPGELKGLARKFALLARQKNFDTDRAQSDRQLYRARLRRVESELTQRGYR
jgi:hypothetical protein